MSATDVVAGAALISGAAMSMLAGIAVLRFPDVMSRIHAATKPQVLGIMLMMLGVGIRIGTPAVIGVLILIVLLQFVTAPISAHLVVRAAYRRDQRPDNSTGKVGLSASDLHEPAIGSVQDLPGEESATPRTGKSTAARAGAAAETTGYGPTVADVGVGDVGSDTGIDRQPEH